MSKILVFGTSPDKLPIRDVYYTFPLNTTFAYDLSDVSNFQKLGYTLWTARLHKRNPNIGDFTVKITIGLCQTNLTEQLQYILDERSRRNNST